MRLLSHDLYWRNKKYKLKRSIFALFVCIGQRNVLEKCDCKLVVSLIMAKFVVSRCVFRKLRRNFGFFCSVNHLSGPLRKQIITCDWCISIQFFCFCLSSFVACDRPVSGNSRPVFFKYFSDLSYSYSRVILSFVFAGQAGRVRCIVININSGPTQMFDGTEKPIRSLQTCSAIQRM